MWYISINILPHSYLSFSHSVGLFLGNDEEKTCRCPVLQTICG